MPKSRTVFKELGMQYVFAILIAIFYSFLLFPFVKLYQLKGYNPSQYFENVFSIRLSLKGKNTLKFTKRVVRLVVLFFVIEVLIWFGILSSFVVWWIIAIDLFVNLIFLPFVLLFLHYLLCPIEKLIKTYYISKTKVRLKKFKGKVIAITGSFGKTTTKNVLKEMLACCYKVVSTPFNYNTPMGVTKTVLKELKEDTEILIIEMGARHRGDIKELCEIVKPDIGILTSIGEQHLETFGNLETVLQTKFELCENLSPSKKCYFDCYNDNTRALYEKAVCKKIGLGDDAKVDFLSANKNGMTIEVEKGKEKIKLKTNLLGVFSGRDIALCTLVALDLGVKEKQIKTVVENLKPTPHRLELIQNGSLNILDDSYNSNLNGFAEALNVLAMFEGQKVVVTPGLVELGQRQYEYNFKMGKLIAKTCDKVIIMNKTNKKALKNGILSEKYAKNNIFFAETREEQKELLSKIVVPPATILFENDLPDDYK